MQHHSVRSAVRDLHHHYTAQREAQRRVLKQQLKALHEAQETIEKLEHRLIEAEEAMEADREAYSNLKKAYETLLQAQQRRAKKAATKRGDVLPEERMRINSNGSVTPGTVAPSMPLNVSTVF